MSESGLIRTGGVVVLSGPALHSALQATLITIRNRKLTGLPTRPYEVLAKALGAAMAADRDERSGRPRRPNGEIAYNSAHDRVRRVRGSAKAHMCVDDCGNRAAHWSYDYSDPSELIDPRGVYSPNPDRYQPRCIPCHTRFDSQHEMSVRGQSVIDQTELAQPDAVDEHPTVPLAEAAARLNISDRQARRLAPQLGGRMIAGRWFVDELALRQHIEGRKA